MNQIYKDKKFWNIFLNNKIKELKYFGKGLLITIGVIFILLAPYLYGKFFWTKPLSHTPKDGYTVHCSPNCMYNEGQPFSIITNFKYNPPTQQDVQKYCKWIPQIQEAINAEQGWDFSKITDEKFRCLFEGLVSDVFNDGIIDARSTANEELIRKALSTTDWYGIKSATYITNEFVPARPHNKDCVYIKDGAAYHYGFAYFIWLMGLGIVSLLISWISSNLIKARKEYEAKYM